MKTSDSMNLAMKMSGNRLNKKLAVAASLALVMSIPCLNAMADSDTTTAPNSASQNAPEASSTVLQGGVQKTAKQAMLGLRSITDASGKLKRAASDLFGECSRHDQQIEEEPEMIGGTIIEIPISFDLGPCLPPRKKYVDLFMSHIEQFDNLLDEEVAGILIPDDKTESVNPVMSNMNVVMQDVDSRLASLKQLTGTKPYPGTAIGQQCKLISDDMKQLNELTKKAFHLVKDKHS